MRTFILTASLILALGASPSLAHSPATSTTPANGAVLATPPPQFTLTFGEATKLTQLTIQRAGDRAARSLGPLPAEAGQHFQIKAPPLTPGKYALRYRAVGHDGHAATTVVKFTVKPPPGT
jgi:methionine-rich copper-binding protein CopC